MLGIIRLPPGIAVESEPGSFDSWFAPRLVLWLLITSGLGASGRSKAVRLSMRVF